VIAAIEEKVGRALNYLFQDQLPGRGGVIAFTRSPAVSDADRARIVLGTYRRGLRRAIERGLPDLDVVVLGAGAGLIATYAARRLGAGRQLVCVEDDPALVPLIAQNIAINAPATRLVVLQGPLPEDEVLRRAGIAGRYVRIADRVEVIG
jgi:hypothetical protein